MAFQNNSGDIILDVVLTDEGRRRLAKGDNSFSIVKLSIISFNMSMISLNALVALDTLAFIISMIKYSK